MEQPIIANGGLQIVPQIAVQYVYLDFDGELTSYNGEILTVDNVEVKDSSLTEERIAYIVAELNAKYASQNVIFVTEKPENTAYSTVFIGKTDAFNAYGSFKGVAETIDKGNLNRSDNAFVMLDASAADTEIISTISHETDHLLGILDHGGSGLYAYADSSVNSGEIFIGKVLTNEKMHVNSGGTVVSTIVDSCGELHVSNGGTANFALLSGYKAAMYISSGGVANSTTVNTTSGGASMCVFEGGAAFDTTLNGYYAYMYVSNGGSAHNITLTKSAAIWGWEGGVVSNITLDSAGSAVAAHGAVLNDINVYSGDINVYDDARVNNVTLHSSGAVMTVGGKAVDVTVYAGGSVQMGTYGSVDNITVHSGGNLLRVVEHNAFTNLTVNSGGIINHFMIAEDKFWEHISSGPVYLADNVYILNSTIYINEGGVANGIVANPNATTSNYATINIYSGGTASNVTMNSRSHLHISSGALA
ncbi:MAG: hypothetical protein J6W00_14240, partial [Lentisphaeria bacterium]|nr:hypothetical protein [Lentisphaeria bacterium]